MYVRCSLREIPSPLCSFNWVILSKKSLNTVNCDIFLLIASDNRQLDFVCIPLQCLEPCYTTTPRASCSRLVMAATVPCCLLPISLNFFLVQGSYKKFAAGWKGHVSFWIFGRIHTGFVPYIQGHFKTSSQIQGLFNEYCMNPGYSKSSTKTLLRWGYVDIQRRGSNDKTIHLCQEQIH